MRFMDHSNIKMAKLNGGVYQHIGRSSDTVREVWKLIECATPKVNQEQSMCAYCAQEKVLHDF